MLLDFPTTRLIEVITPERYGAKGDGVTDDGAALQAAATAAASSGRTLKGFAETYLTSIALDFGGISRIEMGQSLIKQADSSDQTLLVDLTTAVSGGVYFWELNVDGNKDNNTAITGVKICNTQSATLETKINALECDTGINLCGNAEMGRHHFGVWGCTIGVLEESDATYSPDENLLFISGGGCDTFYKKGGVTSTTSIVHLNCEGVQNDYAVIIDKNRLTTLSGMIRGSDGGGVKVIHGSVVFNGFAIYASGTGGGSEYGLLVEDAVSITGDVIIRSAASNAVNIVNADALDLDIYMRTIAGKGLEITGELTRGKIKLYANAITGVALTCDETGGGHNDITIYGTCDDITVNAGAAQDTIRIPASKYSIPITNNATNTRIVYYGSMSLAERDAIANPFEGMYCEDIRNSDHLPSVYLNGAWRILAPDGVHTQNGETVTTVAPALKTWGYSYIDTGSNDVAATLADGQFPGQVKTIVLTDATEAADGGTTVTVAHHEDGDAGVYTFKAVDDVCVFMWKGTEWYTMHSDLTA